MVRNENFDRVQVESAAELRGWLVDHHVQDDSVWHEVLDELVSFGWIDGIRRKLRWMKVTKTEATRSKRIATTAQLAIENRRVPNA